MASFELARGERAAVVGRSGSGKTTLLRLLAGLEPCVGGRITLEGRDLTALAPEKRGLGYVFQDQALFPALDVLGNVAFGLQARGVVRSEREDRARDWLARVGLADRARDDVRVLSGGERQRVAFARALVIQPAALLLDEPFSALDGVSRGELRSRLLELHSEWPVPLLLVTHDPEDARALANVRINFSEAENGRIRHFKRDAL
jgi:ABC-type Fe3+/spermidine/putrescine transport system ATPase subunit